MNVPRDMTIWAARRLREALEVTAAIAGDNQFDNPLFICHQVISDTMCHIIVSDSNNHCIKVFSDTGEFVMRFGCKGAGDRQLQYPRGVCVDPLGRIVVCDMNNNRVVLFWWDGEERWEVLLDEAALDGSQPWCVSMTDDGTGITFGMNSGELISYSMM